LLVEEPIRRGTGGEGEGWGRGGEGRGAIVGSFLVISSI